MAAQNMPAQALNRPMAPRSTTGPTLAPIELVLARLEPCRLRENGPDRWRACCPAHGGSNPSALSVGLGDNGGVLLKCWSGCDVAAVAAALGLDVADLFPSREAAASPLKRRRLITATQALDVLNAEANLVTVAACNVAQGLVLTGVDRERLVKAAGRINFITQETRK